MHDLLRAADAGRNAPRNFWLWVARQPWRHMFPNALEYPGSIMFLLPTATAHMNLHLVMNTSMTEYQGYIQCSRTSRWHKVTIWGLGTFSCPQKCCLAHAYCLISNVWFPQKKLRFAGIYHYDRQLFAKRFLGEPGVPQLYIVYIQTYAYPLSWSLAGNPEILGASTWHWVLQEPPCAFRPGSSQALVLI